MGDDRADRYRRHELADAEQAIDNALRAFKESDVATTSTWQVHATASDLYRKMGRRDAATTHHMRALKHLEALLDSFDRDEPIRQTMLAASVRPLRDQSVKMKL